jgi:hypothetical protein
MVPTKLRYTLKEFSELTSTPRCRIFQRIHRGELSVVKDGRCMYITHQEAERYAKATLPLISEPAETV